MPVGNLGWMVGTVGLAQYPIETNRATPLLILPKGEILWSPSRRPPSPLPEHTKLHLQTSEEEDNFNSVSVAVCCSPQPDSLASLGDIHAAPAYFQQR